MENSNQIQNSDIESNSLNSGDYTVIDSKKLRKKIISEKIYPFYLDEIDENLSQRKIWSTIYSIFSALTIVVISASSIVSFSAPQFPNVTYISYVAGVLGVISLMCERFTNYCSIQSSASTQRINVLMSSIGINDTIPDIMKIKIEEDFISGGKIKKYEQNETNQKI